MNEGIPRGACAIPTRQTAVSRQGVSEFFELAAGIGRIVRFFHAVVQVDLHFTPTGAAVPGKAIEQAFVIVLGRINIGVPERKAVLIAPLSHRLRIIPAPLLDPLLLHIPLCVPSWWIRDVGGL